MIMSTDKLRGQFLRDDKPKPKKSIKSSTMSCSSYSSNVSEYGGYKQNGWVLPKRGAL